MTTPLVSVIVPVHNTEQFLRECIESILRQTYKNIELVLVDDYSIDNSRQICEEFEKKDKRVKLYKLTCMSGVSKARNFGIINSNGIFACFIDSDDFIDVDYIEKYIEIICQYKVSAVFGLLKYFQDGKTIKRRGRLSEGIHTVENTASILIDDGTLSGILFGSVCGAMYNLEFIRNKELRFEESLTKNEDGIFNLDFLSQSENFYMTHYDGYFYRQWKDSYKIPLFEPDSGLIMASEVIKDRYSSIQDFKCQMQRRSISIIFWNAITVGQCEGSWKLNCRRLKKYINDSQIDSCYFTIRTDVMSKYKRILIHLLYKRKVFMFYCIMKYAYPVLNRFR